MASKMSVEQRKFRCTTLHVLPLEDRNAPTPTISVGPNIDISQRTGAQSETAIAINPTNTQNLIAGANDDTLANANGGHFYAYSTDGGTTWTHPYQLGSSATPTIPDSAGDPTFAFDRFGNAYAGYLSNTGVGTGVALVTSSNGGLTFSNNSPVAAGFNDQPKIATGVDATNAARDTIWETWNNNTNSISVSGAAVTGLGAVGAMTAPVTIVNSGNRNFGDIAVGPAGQVLVAFQDANFASNTSSLYTSLDPDGLGGAAFTDPNTRQIVATNVDASRLIPATTNNFGIDAEVRVAFDKSGGAFNGRAYMVYTDALTDGTTGNPNLDDETYIKIRSSTDNGQTWSAPINVGTVTAGKSQFNPQLAVDPTTGIVGVSWYDSRNSGPANNTVQLYAAFSDDGGATFKETLVSAGTSNSSIVSPPPPGLRDIGPGDYNRGTFYGGFFYASWADNSNSTGNNPDGTSNWDIYTAKIGINQPIPPVPPSPPGPPGPPGPPTPGPPRASVTVVGSGVGQIPYVKQLDASGNVIRQFVPYFNGFDGGVNAASGDVTGDGIPDVVTAPASHGGADIRVFDGATGQQIAAFLAYDARFDGGASVAIGDVDGDGIGDIITGAGYGGGPHVRVFHGGDFKVMKDFLAFSPNFRGGVSVASADFDQNGKWDVVVGAGADGGGDVRIFKDGNVNSATDVLTADPRYRGGVTVAAGDVDNDGIPDLIVGAASETAAVSVFSGGKRTTPKTFDAYFGFTGGVRVAYSDPDGDGHGYIVTAPGSGGGANIRAFNFPGDLPFYNILLSPDPGGATVG